jgi:hypothetical protein
MLLRTPLTGINADIPPEIVAVLEKVYSEENLVLLGCF